MGQVFHIYRAGVVDIVDSAACGWFEVQRGIGRRRQVDVVYGLVGGRLAHALVGAGK